MSPLEPEVPPVGEEIHLPGPSLLPVLLAVGLTLAIVGVTLGWIFWLPGLILSLVVSAVWIRDSRRELEGLPLEHRH